MGKSDLERPNKAPVGTIRIGDDQVGEKVGPPKNGEIALQTPRTSRLLDC